MTTRELEAMARRWSPTDEKLDRIAALLEQILEKLTRELEPAPQTKGKR